MAEDGSTSCHERSCVVSGWNERVGEEAEAEAEAEEAEGVVGGEGRRDEVSGSLQDAQWKENKLKRRQNANTPKHNTTTHASAHATHSRQMQVQRTNFECLCTYHRTQRAECGAQP